LPSPGQLSPPPPTPYQVHQTESCAIRRGPGDVPGHLTNPLLPQGAQFSQDIMIRRHARSSPWGSPFPARWTSIDLKRPGNLLIGQFELLDRAPPLDWTIARRWSYSVSSLMDRVLRSSLGEVMNIHPPRSSFWFPGTAGNLVFAFFPCKFCKTPFAASHSLDSRRGSYFSPFSQ